MASRKKRTQEEDIVPKEEERSHREGIIGTYWSELTMDERRIAVSMEEYFYTGSVNVWAVLMDKIENRLMEKHPEYDEGIISAS